MFVKQNRNLRQILHLCKDQNNKTYAKFECQITPGGWKFVPLDKLEEILEQFEIDRNFIKM